MKIAIFHNLSSGGAKRALYELLKYLAKRNSVDVFYTKFGTKKDFLNMEDLKGIKYRPFAFPYPQNFFQYLKLVYLDLPKIHKRIANLMNKKTYNVVIVAHDFWTKSPYLLRYLKHPIVYWCHEPPREFYEDIFQHIHSFREVAVNILRLPIKKIDFENVKCSDMIITGSEFMQKTLQSVYKRNDILVVKNGVDLDFFKDYKLKRKKILLSVGALTRLKGHDFIIRSVARSASAKKFRLVIVGNGGKDEIFLLNLGKRLRINIEIKKFISDKELVYLYNRAFLLLYAPINEPFGLVPLEAMACGLPVLAVKEGGICETVTPKVGWLVKRNEKKFSEKLNELISKEYMVKRRRNIVRKYVESKWSWENFSKQFTSYLELCSDLRK